MNQMLVIQIKHARDSEQGAQALVPLCLNITYRDKLHVVNDWLLEGPCISVQQQRHHHDQEHNVGLDVYSKSRTQVDNCHQDQVA